MKKLTSVRLKTFLLGSHCEIILKKSFKSISKPANQTVQSKVPKETAKEKPKAVIDQSVKRSDSKEKSQVRFIFV